jgi:hypothetical protein
MTVTAARAVGPVYISRFRFSVPASVAFYKGEAVGFERAGSNAGKIIPMDLTAAVDPIYWGYALENVSTTQADRKINAGTEEIDRWAYWYTNATSTNAVAATDVGSECYFSDAGTITITPNRFRAGLVLEVDTTRGMVLVLPLTFGAVPAGRSPAGPTLSYTSNAAAPAAIVNGATYDVPTTAAASTVTLPAAAPNGTIAYFAADGTKNGHTVQYVDETGTANLTTALTASKRHLVTAIKAGGKWFASVYVGP